MAARYRGKFLLLKQFRHALRAEQYSFPRGYAEPRNSPLENVKRELKEELNAVVSRSPLSLGYIEPDSGLTSRKIEIFLVDVDGYSYRKGYEEILDVKEMAPEELEKVRTELFTDPIIQESGINTSLAQDYDFVIEVGFLPGVTDNVGKSSAEGIADFSQMASIASIFGFSTR